MPFKDPEKRRVAHNDWKKRMMAQGYGKVLYARRKQRFEAERILREAIERVLANEETLSDAWVGQTIEILYTALEKAPPITGKPLDFMPKEKK